MPERRANPYVWVTWLTKLLVGENSCEWAACFRANHEGYSYEKVPSTFDATGWQLNHTALINHLREQLESDGKTVFTENQNSFTLRGASATLGGKPDLITIDGATGTIYDAKTGRPSPSHHIQVMVYMYAVPKVLRQFKGVEFNGKVVYNDHEVSIPAEAINETFVANLGDLVKRIASAVPARKVPSAMECGFCNITKADCPDRTAGDVIEGGETGDF